MTPAARISAAMEILDRVLAGAPAEQALTNWARGSRFAGSGDRNAIRDLVYDALRCRRSYAALGGAETGRGLMLGALRASGSDPATLFTGQGHAPSPLGPADVGRAPEGAEALDLPDWLVPLMAASLSDDLPAVAHALRQRAPVFLRVNLRRTTVPQAIAALATDGITAQPHALADTALEVLDGARKIQTSQAYLTGLIELQDAASQAVVNALPLRDGMRVLDHCAGGGGKTLAMAARAALILFAHDAVPGRMRDLAARAARAGVKVTTTDRPEGVAPFDLILADAPCSGSGSWRRDPQGKWALTPDRLAEIGAVQDSILDRLAPMIAPGGVLAYATCSLLTVENEDRIRAFVDRTPGWQVIAMQRFTPLTGGDGFFLAQLTQSRP
ncbi:MAG: RsmB/NOP family class I SAM-dependent RNA methyltransferase [Pseudotabrizicola sp.]|uniref:RsmB/NOP family class I SAM-dependent RNA methyltransferase n=1 Tax=Pseudotabrizicola sp. TaxID=2939647 RepID=UPI0027186F07|nr:RsmB/NOP family class I SAM-dependent RNA methyltransferase [Pseudotabrizicola sp.]MDO8884083.1 RsmB/NOP family class I SAM-dependent RNA methyltransferase [Pseudotabrizicola sp.]MDP2082628.1 RsmB/NOP family class I SAM-dependent RNA methyltransferase [Pseudotabrizicola sp.]MDZ7573524.1 RsmB/NOP family class I SAM-dependent RNA methyltransferase [Pseudotabrizicola sp.]